MRIFYKFYKYLIKEINSLEIARKINKSTKKINILIQRFINKQLVYKKITNKFKKDSWQIRKRIRIK